MIPRKRIAETKEIMIENTCFEDKIVTSEKLVNTVQKQLKLGDQIIGLEERRGFRDPGFGAMDDEKVWYNYWVLIVRFWRDETDAEYFNRCKFEENQRKQKEERDRLTYLELKARFEPEEQQK